MKPSQSAVLFHVYARRKVNERVIHQLNMIGHQSLNYLHSPMHEYAEKLVAKMPGDLKVAYFTNSGSEANELAMLMASLYTGSNIFVTLRWAMPVDAHQTTQLSTLHRVGSLPWLVHWGCCESPVTC